MSNKIYENKIKGFGDLAEAFKEENMIILFGDNAPETLADYCYSININPVKETLKVGQIFGVDGKEFKITAIGKIAQRNLQELGHITINFNGSIEEPLPGTICVEKKEMPNFEIGSEIYISI